MTIGFWQQKQPRITQSCLFWASETNDSVKTLITTRNIRQQYGSIQVPLLLVVSILSAIAATMRDSRKQKTMLVCLAIYVPYLWSSVSNGYEGQYSGFVMGDANFTSHFCGAHEPDESIWPASRFLVCMWRIWINWDCQDILDCWMSLPLATIPNGAHHKTLW